MIIDLRSDTFTKPTPGMMEAMMSAEVGDDVWGEDPTVIHLEQKAAQMFAMESALFCPSGTMANQIAIKVHTQAGDEVICDHLSHVYRYEGGGIAFNSSASVALLEGKQGQISASQIKAVIQPDDVHFPISRMVSLENTTNKGGGACYEAEALEEIHQLCKKESLALHLDGARLFNALRATGQSPKDFGNWFDSISICLSKGLGTPIGSVLLGTSDFIKKAKRIRKVLGGGMRQAGFLAAAGIYALDYHVERLDEDHSKAKRIEAYLQNLAGVSNILPVHTNIVIFDIVDGIDKEALLENWANNYGVKASGMGSRSIRLVTHLDISETMMPQIEKALKETL